MLPPPPRSTLFPYTTLFRSAREVVDVDACGHLVSGRSARLAHESVRAGPGQRASGEAARGQDRKSTRLNSSHPSISYAVFCLKKKKKKHTKRLTSHTNKQTT